MLLIGAGWTALAGFDVWLLLIRPDASWDAKIAFVLGMLGVYTFAFGVLAASGVLKRLPDLGRNLTSPNPTIFLAGNFTVMSMLLGALSVALRSKRTRESLERRGGSVLYLAETPLLLLGVVVIAAFVVVYLVLVAPLAWIASTISSAALDSILGSASDLELIETRAQTGEVRTVRIKELVEEHLVTFRNLLIAVPSLVSSLILDAPGLI
jgi:hypothetical protein